MAGNLGTTNLLLGVMAAVSLLEGLLLVGAGIALFSIYRRVMTLVEGIEARQVAPAMERVHAILDDLQSIAATVKEEADRVDHAIRSTIDRVDDTAGRVRSNVRAKTSWVVGAIRGLRVAIEEVLSPNGKHHPPPAGASGPVM